VKLRFSASRLYVARAARTIIRVFDESRSILQPTKFINSSTLPPLYPHGKILAAPSTNLYTNQIANIDWYWSDPSAFVFQAVKSEDRDMDMQDQQTLPMKEGYYDVSSWLCSLF